MKRVSTKEALPEWNIGEFTYGIPSVRGYSIGKNQGKLVIGKFCSIADQVTIFLGGNHRTDWISTYPFMLFPDEWAEAKDIPGHPESKGDVIIGHDVWLAHRAIIMSGVNIGHGAIVGAGAVVTKSVRPYAIVAGNPAQEMRRRFPDEIVERLLEIKWWDWHPKTIKKHVGKLCSSQVGWMLEGTKV